MPRPDVLPNILVLLADNLAYDDVGAFRSGAGEIDKPSRTPRLDSFAESSRKFLNWNSPAVLCSASRAALLTGRYPVRTGVYPRVFEPDAAFGLLPNETTLAEYLKDEGYATKIVGKWHLGQRPNFLPTEQGFDEWFGIPYHMSGGSIDDHVCGKDKTGKMWLPLFDGKDIVEQPVRLDELAPRYVDESISFIEKQEAAYKPWFLYLAFSHVHQLCAPRNSECQWASTHFSRDKKGYNATFGDAVEEMDWIAGEVLDSLHRLGAEDNTLVVFTSDNGPWVAEGACAGSKGKFEGRWLAENVDQNCTACPSEYSPSPLPGQPRRCVYPGTKYQVEGVHCGQDTGLGSAWEANVIMPAIARWPAGGVEPGTQTLDLVSTLDLVPTVLSLLGTDIPLNIDGVDVSHSLLGTKDRSFSQGDDRAIFFWRDGFRAGPLPQPFGRFDVVAAKIGKHKLWFYTKSSHYNGDEEVFHDPPLIFNVLDDPGEAHPLDPEGNADLVERAKVLVDKHKRSIDWSFPLTLARDPKYLPCSSEDTNCRIGSSEGTSIIEQ